MTKNQILSVRSWTTPKNNHALLVVSQRPISAKKMDQVRIGLQNDFEKAWDDSEYELGMENNPKYHQKLKKLIRQCLPEGFQLLEVGEFTIA